MKNDINELKERIKKLTELLKECLPAMCSYRFKRGVCSECKDSMYCLSRTMIPKVEKEVGKVKKND